MLLYVSIFAAFLLVGLFVLIGLSKSLALKVELEQTLGMEKQKELTTVGTALSQLTTGSFELRGIDLSNWQTGSYLLDLANRLQQTQNNQSHEEYRSKGIEQLTTLLRQTYQNREGLVLAILTFLNSYLDCQAAALYWLENDKSLSLQGSLGTSKSHQNKYLKFDVGEGLLGQAFKETGIKKYDQLPNHYAALETGLGNSQKLSGLFLTLTYNQTHYGIIELLSFHPFTEKQVALLQHATEYITSTLANEKINSETRRLLSETRAQAKQLAEKENELRANNEELRKIHTQLEIQKAELEHISENLKHKNISITDSINYAKTIQYSFLPEKNVFNHFFADSFSLFQPKDIISGDFYWAYKENDTTLWLVCADCTGHGVPGTLLSLIALNSLNTMVKYIGLEKPSELLFGLHHEIFSVLHQGTTGNNDGLDLTIAKFQKTKNGFLMTYSGAKSYFFLIQNNTIELVRTGRKSVGAGLVYQDNPFEDSTLELNKPTKLYFLTDGYPDTANPERQKFGMLKLQENILKFSNLNMQDQEQQHVKALLDHQANQPQRDDITLLGFQL